MLNDIESDNEALNRKINALLLKIDHQNSILTDIKNVLDDFEAGNVDARNSLGLVKQKLIRVEQVDNRWLEHYEQLNPTFFEILNSNSQNLTQNELRHCAYIKMNMSKKEVAQLLGVNSRSVEMAHYRLKKKLKVDGMSLKAFISSIGRQGA